MAEIVSTLAALSGESNVTVVSTWHKHHWRLCTEQSDKAMYVRKQLNITY